MLAAIREVRCANRRIVLVTGRILVELLVDFPDAYEHFDAVVAENGAVLWHGARERALGSPVSASLDQALGGRGVPFRRGLVLLAADAAPDQATALEACKRLCEIASCAAGDPATAYARCRRPRLPKTEAGFLIPVSP
jgi:hypothetical protein